jgi:hypothetical protein
MTGLGFFVLNPLGIYVIQSEYSISKITETALRERSKNVVIEIYVMVSINTNLHITNTTEHVHKHQ